MGSASNLSLNLSKVIFAETIGLFKSKGTTSRFKPFEITNYFSVLNLSYRKQYGKYGVG
jgi:hypothetical protein